MIKPSKNVQANESNPSCINPQTDLKKNIKLDQENFDSINVYSLESIKNNSKEKKHLIIDTSYLLYRSYFAYPHLKTGEKHTGAIFGFFKSIASLMTLIKPDSVYFALDLPKNTWRHEIHSGYKAGRPPIENEMKEQIPIVLEMLKKCAPKNVLSLEGFEADDVIFTLSQKLDGEVYIFSSDKDLYQLFTRENLVFVKSHKGIISFYRKHQFLEDYGVSPELWVDFKALTGDKSDNLDGVTGVGPKTAANLIQETGGLKNIFKFLGWNEDDLETGMGAVGEEAGRVGGVGVVVGDKSFEETGLKFLNSEKGKKLVEKIKIDKEKLLQTYKLARLQTVPGVDLNEKNPDFNLLFEDFLEFNFKNIITQMQKNSLMNPDLKIPSGGSSNSSQNSKKKINLIGEENALF